MEDKGRERESVCVRENSIYVTFHFMAPFSFSFVFYFQFLSPYNHCEYAQNNRYVSVHFAGDALTLLPVLYKRK